MNNRELETKIKELVRAIVYTKGYVCSIDLLLGLEILSKTDHDSWRVGKIDYLERVCKINLHKLSFINKTLRSTANDLKLIGSWTFYRKYGKGNKTVLRFSKSGDDRIEKLYATHYVDSQRISQLKGGLPVGNKG